MGIDGVVAKECNEDNSGIGDWENDPFDSMAPAYDSWLCVKTEIRRVYEDKMWRNPDKEFREKLKIIYYHLSNFLSGR